MLPIELEVTLAGLDYEEDGGILINQITLLGEDLHIGFILSINNEGLKQPWRIIVKDIISEKAELSWAKYPELYSDHYLLYEFIDPYTEIYFNGKAKNSEKLFIDLYKIYLGLYNEYLKFGYGINAPDGILNLCKQESGLFARGPKRILENYEKILNKHGIKTNYIGSIEPENNNAKLLIIGNSYFVGQSFEFKRIK